MRAKAFAAAGAVVLTAGTLQIVTPAAPAAATTPSSVITLDCDSATVQLSGYNGVKPGTPEVYGYQYTISNDHKNHPGNVPGGPPGQWSGSSWHWVYRTNDYLTSAPNRPNGGGYGSWVKDDNAKGVVTPAVPEDTSPNSITIVLNGTTEVDTTFAASYSWSTALDGQNGNRLQVSVTAWDDATYNLNFDQTTSGCGPVTIPVPPAPKAVAPTCESAGQLTVPADTEQVTWTKVNGFTVKATANPGYLFSDGKTVEYYFEVVLPKLFGDQCATVVQLVSPTVRQVTCESPTPSLTLPENGGGVYYIKLGWVSPGKTVVVSAIADLSHRFARGQLPDGWTFLNAHLATFKVSFDVLGECPIAATLVGPTVTQSVCTGPGTHSAPSVVAAADGNGVEYTVAPDLSKVTATLQPGYKWPLPLPSGWAPGQNALTMVYQVTLLSPGACLVSVSPVTPEAQAGTCDLGTGVVSPATITSPTDGLDSGGITYAVSGLTVTATADAGHQIVSAPDGWSLTEGVWTFVAGVTQPFCPAVIGLPITLPPATGSLTGVPPTTTQGQILETVTGTGFAPGATVNFGIYSTPTLLATVSADANGVATVTITIPADIALGDHTVLAAGTGPTGSPMYLQAGTTVITTTPSSSSGVAGESTTANPPSGSSSTAPLANTGTREDPIALVQFAVMALLVGGALLALGRRGQAHRH